MGWKAIFWTVLKITLSPLHHKSGFAQLFFFPGGLDSKEFACSVRDLGSSLGREDPLEKGKTPVLLLGEFLSGEFHGQRSLVCYSPWDPKESDTSEQVTLSLFFFLKHHQNIDSIKKQRKEYM